MKGFLVNFKQGNHRHFIQPLAVALVFLLFALLFFVTAMIDLGRLEALLMDTLRKKALQVVDVIETASREKYTHLMRDREEYQNLSASAVIDDQSFSLQESLVGALIDMARYVEQEEQTGTLVERKALELASTEHLLAVCIFDEHGGLAFQSGLVPSEIITQIRSGVRGKEEIAVHLFRGAKELDSPGFVAIRKHTGGGTVALVLDRHGIEYWGWRVVIQAAMKELRWGAGIAYFSVEGKGGKVLARFGNIPRDKVEECLLIAGAARAKKSADVQCVKVGDTKLLEFSFPFAWEGNNIGTAHVGLETHETDRLLIENRKRIFLWTGLMVLIGLFAMGILYRTQNRHVAKIQEMRERLYQAERLSSLGKLGAGVAHEIRNPLNAISMAAQRLQPGGTEEKLKRISQVIRDEIKRLNKIVEDFLSLSRSDRIELQEQSIIGLLDQLIFLLQEEARPRGICIQKQWTHQSLMVLMDAGKMEQALLNIIRNAMESISGEGCITLMCDTHGKQASIRIKDSGIGIPAGEEKRIFDPFYTSKKNGIGLGLAIAHEIVAAHGGEIRVKSEIGTGSTFEVLLPLRS